MSRAIDAQPASPDDVTPTIASTPPTIANAGPPESPSHVCDGAGAKPSSSADSDAITVAPVRWRGAAVPRAAARPKPTRRSGPPIAPPSSAADGSGHGIAAAGAG